MKIILYWKNHGLRFVKKRSKSVLCIKTFTNINLENFGINYLRQNDLYMLFYTFDTKKLFIYI